MSRNLYLPLTVCLTALLISCNPEMNDSGQQGMAPVSPAVSVTSLLSTESSDPLIPDSIVTYRPPFGNGNTVRQFPFSLVNQPATTVRLTQLIYNGKIIRNYAYNDQGRLAERTDYYTNGIQVYKKFAYSYGMNALTGSTSQLNKEAPYVEGYPQKSDLLPSTSTTYVSMADSIAWTQKTIVIAFLDSSPKSGTVVSRLGFNPTGALIWEEQKNDQGKLSQYILYRRNEVDNVVLRRTGYLSNRWEAYQFTYDNKPNPFRTTGDLQSLALGQLAGVDITNPNNVLNQSFTNSEGGQDKWRYSYEYRPDGYPYRMLAYHNEALTSTIEFSYNQ